MNKESKHSQNLLIAVKKGYYVDKDGNVYHNDNKIKPQYDKHAKIPYYRFNIRGVNNSYGYVQIHQLQAYQKFGDKIWESETIRHLNGNSLDNSYDNIEIGTFSENMLDIPQEMRIKQAIIATSFVKKHDHKEIIKYYNMVKSYKKVMEKFNISSKGTLNFIIKNSIESNN